MLPPCLAAKHYPRSLSGLYIIARNPVSCSSRLPPKLLWSSQNARSLSFHCQLDRRPIRTAWSTSLAGPRVATPKTGYGEARTAPARPLRGRRVVSPSRRSWARGFLTCRAISLPDTIDATLRNAASIAAVVGISYAILLAAVSEPTTPPPSAAPRDSRPRALGAGGARASGAKGGHEDDDFMWGLMGFISCLPLFSWLAWVLAAMSDEDRAVLYGTYAALYGTPLLLRGLDWQDPWSLFMLFLCAVHVQAERISRTEPETLRALRPVGAVGALLRGAVRGTGSFLSGLGGVLAEDSRRVARRPGGRSSEAASGSNDRKPTEIAAGEDRLKLGRETNLADAVRGQQDPRREAGRDPELEDFATRELRQFDEQLRRKEEERRNKGGGGGGGGWR